MGLNREQADVVAPGAWLTLLVAVGLFALPLLVPIAVIATLVLGIYYSARDANGHE